MASEIDRILATELGRLGGAGARLVARWLPSDTGEETIGLDVDRAALGPRVAALLATIGRPVELTDGDGATGVSAVTGSGRLRLNPAVVTVWITHADDGARLRVRAVAKEGHINQRGGQQVAREVAAALRRLGDPLP